MKFIEFYNKEFMIWASSVPELKQSVPGLFLLTVKTFSIFGWKDYNQSDFSIDHLVMVMSMFRVILCVVGRGCLLWPVSSLGKTVLAFALLHFVLKAKLAGYSRYLLTSYFGIPNPYDEKGL